MSTQISTAFVEQYQESVRMLVQQRGSRLRNMVDDRSNEMSGERAFFDRIGKASTDKKTGRHQPISFSDTPHSRRGVTAEVYDTADAIDSDDQLKLLMSDPAGKYAQAQAWALGRDIDDVIIEAALGDAIVGKNGGSTQALPSGQQVAVDFVEDGSNTTSHLTLDKIREAKRILDANEVEEENRVAVVNADMLRSLLFDDKVISADYNSVRALVQGDLDTFLGFRFVRSERLQGGGTNSDPRKAIFCHMDGVALGMWKDITTNIDPRIDLRARPTQVYTWMQLGAVRMEDTQVVEVNVDESANLTTT